MKNLGLKTTLVLAMSVVLWAEAPTTINYQGYLKGSGGNAITGSKSITFNLYTAPTGGSPIWTSTKSISVADGIYSTVLGDTAALTGLNFDAQYYLGINVESDGEMTPRQPLTSVAYAIKAKKTEQIGTLTNGKICTTDGTLINCTSDATIADGSITESKLADNAVTTAKIEDGTITNADIDTTAAIADTKLATISTTGKVSNSATTATNANSASTIVARDGSGNFSASTITAALTGNASTATALAANGSNCAAGNYPLGVDASGNAEGCTAVGSGDLVSTNNLSDVANAATARTNLGLGSISTQPSNSVNITGGSITGITDLALADGGTGASLSDPNADRVLFWDDSAGSMSFLTLGTNLSITGTTLDATGGISNIVDDTTPQLGGQLDVNGNAIGDGTSELIKFSESASAVNEITITNAATGSAPKISASGDDTNIDLTLDSKGTGKINIAADGTTKYSLPNVDGTSGQVLKTNGSGVVTWQDDTTGGGGGGYNTYSASGTGKVSKTCTTGNAVMGGCIATTPTECGTSQTYPSISGTVISGTQTPTGWTCHFADQFNGVDCAGTTYVICQ